MVNLKLWQEDIAKVDSVIVNEKSSSKTLDVEVKNCDNYNVEVSLGGKMYTGVGSLGVAEVAINEIPTEEKTLVIRLTAPNMNDFRKTLKVKKTTENIQEKKIDVTTLMLWGRDVKDLNSIVVSEKDAPKTLEIGVSNCDDYAVSAKITAAALSTRMSAKTSLGWTKVFIKVPIETTLIFMISFAPVSEIEMKCSAFLVE